MWLRPSPSGCSLPTRSLHLFSSAAPSGGVQPPGASWGTIISDGQNLLYTRPWVAIAPGIMIVLTVLALNVLGDGIRDALDPRAKLRIGG